LPYIVLLTDPTTGGVSASFAMLGDIAISEPGAVIGFRRRARNRGDDPREIAGRIPRAEYLRDHGMIDLVVSRAELRDTLTASSTCCASHGRRRKWSIFPCHRRRKLMSNQRQLNHPRAAIWF